jgi:hypothetical protein
VTFTISADDPRTIRAIEIAADAQHWLTGRNRDGEDIYGVPSQAESGRYYIVTPSSCDCPDFNYQSAAAEVGGADAEAPACKHVLAVRLHRELSRAQGRHGRHAARSSSQAPQPARARGHLSLVVPAEPATDR